MITPASPPPSGPSPPRRRGRLPQRQQTLLGEIRQLIIGGRLHPGARLPVRTELQRRFGASCITVQRVVDRLVADGLVESRGQQGTFVVKRPAHLHRIVLVFPFGPGANGRWRGYYTALARAATRLREGGIDISQCLAEVDRHPAADFERLQDSCRAGLLAGLIFASPPEVWSGTPVADAPLPRIALSHSLQAGVLQVGPDTESFVRRAAATLAARGCRRPAVIASTEISERPEVAERWLRIFAEAGVPIRTQWLLGADLAWPSSAARLARLLFAPGNPERPDALVVADDNFEEAAVAGLLSEGVRVGGDLILLCHANFPLAAASPLPLLRLGFDANALLGEAVERILAIRSGREATSLALPATFLDGS